MTLINSKSWRVALCAFALIAVPAYSHAADPVAAPVAAPSDAEQEAALQDEVKKPGYETALKEKYNLTDAQLKAMRDQKMNDSQITIAAQLAKSSGKSIEDVTKMRLEQKMGWGAIAKELGVHPGEIGKGVSSMHKNPHAKDKASERKERREEQKEKRLEKRQEKAERKESKGKG